MRVLDRSRIDADIAHHQVELGHLEGDLINVVGWLIEVLIKFLPFNEMWGIEVHQGAGIIDASTNIFQRIEITKKDVDQSAIP